MQFMMIVKARPDYEAGAPPNPELLAVIAKHSEEAVKAGILVASGGLLPSSKGARVNVKGGKLSVTDGPFAETKELVGGFAILNASSREEAIQMGKAFMQLHIDVLGDVYEGELEIRQMWEPGKECQEPAVAAKQKAS
ncbi:MAG TPA: YciI family protein [Terriglobales bacterium]